MASEWSLPDEHGVRTQLIEPRAKSTLRGQRLRRRLEVDRTVPSLWPEEWRLLLRAWLTSTLLKVAGHKRAEMAMEIVKGLLHSGWIELDREAGRWKPAWVRFPNLDELRVAIGLPDRTQALRTLNTLDEQALQAVELKALHSSLERFPGRSGHAPCEAAFSPGLLDCRTPIRNPSRFLFACHRAHKRYPGVRLVLAGVRARSLVRERVRGPHTGVGVPDVRIPAPDLSCYDRLLGIYTAADTEVAP